MLKTKTILSDSFTLYVKQCYSNGTAEEQHLRQAFIAGAILTKEIIMDLVPELSEEQVMKLFNSIHEECQAEKKRYSDSGRAERETEGKNADIVETSERAN